MNSPNLLIMGLGNPGKEYSKTYHNVGALFVSFLNKNSEIKKEKKFEYAKDGETILAWPLTYMNQSGEAAKEALKKFNLQPTSLLLVHDDSDIELGKYKVSFGKNAAGHHGVESVLAVLKGGEFSRIRIGIRKEEPEKVKRQKASELVLKKITKADQEIFQSVFSELKRKVIEKETP